jgi:hypothetical protein
MGMSTLYASPARSPDVFVPSCNPVVKGRLQWNRGRDLRLCLPSSSHPQSSSFVAAHGIFYSSLLAFQTWVTLLLFIFKMRCQVTYPRRFTC